MFLAAILIGVLAAVSGEPTNSVDIMAAMASRDTGCVAVSEVYRVDRPTPYIQFHVMVRPTIGRGAAMDRRIGCAEWRPTQGELPPSSTP